MSEVDIDLEILTDTDIEKKIEILRSLLKLTEREKPEKPLRKRVSKKYAKVQKHYIKVIERFNSTRELVKLSLRLNIELVEIILETSGRKENRELKDRVADQDAILKQINKQLLALYKITRIAVRDT